MHIAGISECRGESVTSIDQGGPVVFVILEHSGPSLFEGGAVVRALWFLCLVGLVAIVLLAAG